MKVFNFYPFFTELKSSSSETNYFFLMVTDNVVSFDKAGEKLTSTASPNFPFLFASRLTDCPQVIESLSDQFVSIGPVETTSVSVDWDLGWSSVTVNSDEDTGLVKLTDSF